MNICTATSFCSGGDVIFELTREGGLCELLYDDDLVLMSETIEGLSNKFIKWKEAFKGNG